MHFRGILFFLWIVMQSSFALAADHPMDEVKFIKKLQTCTPGTYLTQKSILGAVELKKTLKEKLDPVTNRVKGLEDGMCRVEISSPKMNTVRCSYSKESIAYLMRLAKNPSIKKREENKFESLSEGDLEDEARIIGECGAIVPW